MVLCHIIIVIIITIVFVFVEATVQKSELPTNFIMEQTDPDKIIFRFLKPGCDKMSGPLLLHAEVGCCNEWCAGTSTWTINSLKQGFFEINRLIPYSNYTVDISAGRKESNQGLMFFHSQSFQTYPKRESFK